MTQVLNEPAQAAEVAPTRPHSRDWIVEVAGKLARREGRDDMARETEITRWCREAAMRFADAPIQAFVPVLVERIVADRIRRERRHMANAAAAMDHCVGAQVRPATS